MTNVTVVFEYEEPEHCRLCLSEGTEDNELCAIREEGRDDEQDLIRVIRELLQIDLDDTDDAIFVCSTCLESLEEFYRYRTVCRQNNVHLKKKAIARKQKQIELAKSAIENTNVLDLVGDGEPIKVIIRMNAEGKTSLRLQVQSKKQPSTEVNATNSSNSDPSTSKARSSPERSKLPTPEPQSTPAINPAALKPSNKLRLSNLISLPKQDFYFFKLPSGKHGLIYGGYRYYGFIPRHNQTFWMCEQRKSQRCDTMLFVDRAYGTFFINRGHCHDPPTLEKHMMVFKSQDVLPDVIRKEKLREQQLALKSKHQITEEIQLPEDELNIKQESDDDDDENTDEDDEEDPNTDDEADAQKLANYQDDSDEKDHVKNVEVKSENPEEHSSHCASSQVQIEAGDNTYIIQELT
ncbi:uncharacterized protein LOC129749905 [Uranotaenia lowii]|uniref:uncharacterized protein LOC129749905 n=1 Tax=Uranotaenia lowii TaxID=190385 RepID=UPI0024789B9F|nr:uncharacterized protein LOC129749905 [Uranotaenia lowii]